MWYSKSINIENWGSYLVGGYAAVIATIALLWNIFRERRKVIVKFSFGFGVGAFSGSKLAIIDVINYGHYDINVQEVGFYRSDKMKIIDPQANHILRWVKGHGDNQAYYFVQQFVNEMIEDTREKGLKITHVYFRNADRIYKGKIKADFSYLR